MKLTLQQAIFTISNLSKKQRRLLDLIRDSYVVPLKVNGKEVRKKVEEIYDIVPWFEVAESYLDKPYTWLSSKFTKDNEEFTKEEIEKLRNALLDIAERITSCAQKI